MKLKPQRKSDMPVIGGVYAHFKRDKGLPDTDNSYKYLVLAVATHTETGEEFVVYQALYEPFKVYARPIVMFMSKVDSIKYPEHAGENRFVYTEPTNSTKMLDSLIQERSCELCI